jgi:hypothetical protein
MRRNAQCAAVSHARPPAASAVAAAAAGDALAFARRHEALALFNECGGVNDGDSSEKLISQLASNQQQQQQQSNLYHTRWRTKPRRRN